MGKGKGKFIHTHIEDLFFLGTSVWLLSLMEKNFNYNIHNQWKLNEIQKIRFILNQKDKIVKKIKYTNRRIEWLPTSCNCDDWISFCEQVGEFCDCSKELCTGWELCGVDLAPDFLFT